MLFLIHAKKPMTDMCMSKLQLSVQLYLIEPVCYLHISQIALHMIIQIPG